VFVFVLVATLAQNQSPPLRPLLQGVRLNFTETLFFAKNI